MPLLNTASKVYKGSSAATKVYKGTTQVWSATAPWSPATPAGLVGYWDARDLTAGAITTWVPRNSNGSIGLLAGTGTKTGDQVDTPRFMGSVSAYSSAGMTPSTAKSFWFIGTVTNVGSDVASRPLVWVSNPSTWTGGENGILWYNYNGNVSKIKGGSYNNPAGIAQKSINTRYLWVVTYTSGTSATMYTYTENGSATTIGVASYPTDSVVMVGKRGDNAGNVALAGSVNACGVYSAVLSAGDIASLKVWANANFGVVA